MEKQYVFTLMDKARLALHFELSMDSFFHLILLGWGQVYELTIFTSSSALHAFDAKPITSRHIGDQVSNLRCFTICGQCCKTFLRGNLDFP